RPGLSDRRAGAIARRSAKAARRRRPLSAGRRRRLACPSRPRRFASARVRPRRGDGSARAGIRVKTRSSVLESFNFAIEGVIHVLRTQRNMRIHFAIAVGVIVAAVAVGVSKLELIALLISIAFVLVAEMINTAVEGAIDAATTSF